MKFGSFLVLWIVWPPNDLKHRIWNNQYRNQQQQQKIAWMADFFHGYSFIYFSRAQTCPLSCLLFKCLRKNYRYLTEVNLLRNLCTAAYISCHLKHYTHTCVSNSPSRDIHRSTHLPPLVLQGFHLFTFTFVSCLF